MAVDESEASVRAAEFVNRFFGDFDVEILGLNVAAAPVDWFPAVGYGMIAPHPWYPSPPAVPEAIDRTAPGVESHGERALADSGLDADDAIVETGDPVTVIRNTVIDRSADLVVVGATEKGWWQRLLEGSVSRELATRAECPVLVVH